MSRRAPLGYGARHEGVGGADTDAALVELGRDDAGNRAADVADYSQRAVAAQDDVVQSRRIPGGQQGIDAHQEVGPFLVFEG